MIINTKKIILLFIVAVILLIGIFTSIYTYKLYFKPIVSIKNSNTLFVRTGENFDELIDSLSAKQFIPNRNLFIFFAKKKGLPKHIKAGRYLLHQGMTANALINMLRSGNQQAVKITFNNIRFLPKLAGIIGKSLEADSAKFMTLVTDKAFLKTINKTPETAISIFIPNTYQLWWNTSAKGFIQRMNKEYHKFWTKKRIEQAKELGLSPEQVSILASIVQEETNNRNEMPTIAGVYLNRLKKGMLLQADPTARFAYGDFSIKRVNYNYLKIDSPYNTYKYAGLPPGPICMPNPQTIDQVLHAKKTDYYYFCAKPDKSGTHIFAKNLRQHNRNARKYHRYLNKLRIRH